MDLSPPSLSILPPRMHFPGTVGGKMGCKREGPTAPCLASFAQVMPKCSDRVPSQVSVH